jgi:hypothetical protein
MNKVLKDKDDQNGICVYIAPTKALVNQVAGRIIVFLKLYQSKGIFQLQFIINLALYLVFLHEIIV